MTVPHVEQLSDDVTLYRGDCREILQTLGRVDAVVTDPPYGIGRDKGMGNGGVCFGGKRGVAISIGRYDGSWDDERPERGTIEALLEAGAVHIIWGGQFFADLLPVRGKWLWWDKCQTMPSYGDGELAWTSLPGDAPKRIIYANNGLMAKEKGRVHPTQKPVEVMRWCLGFLPDARTILDPFMGSGTTGVACVQLGRRFIGIEIDQSYFDIACRRIADELKRPRLPLAEPVAAPVQEAMPL